MLRREFGEIQQLLVIEIIAHEVRLDIENELTGEALRPRPCDFGLAGLRRIDLEHVCAVDLVHGEKGSGHAAPRLHKLAPAETQTLAVVVGEFKDALFDALLRLTLRRRQKLAIGDYLRWYRRGGRRLFRSRHQTLLSVTQPTAHRRSP